MSTLGHITSTALNGADSPVFEKAGVDTVLAAVAKQETAVEQQLAAQALQIETLTSALTAFLSAQAPAPFVPEVGDDPTKELTPQEKANATKAAKKAEAEAKASE